MKTAIEISQLCLTSNAGLYHVGLYLKSKEFKDAIMKVSRPRKVGGHIPDIDIIRCWIALHTLGKSDYEAIEEFRDDRNFKNSLDVRVVPSAATLRQRIESLPEIFSDVLRSFNVGIIAGCFAATANDPSRDRRYVEMVRIGDLDYAVIDSDVTILDNSDSHKEGLGWTYGQCMGYAPMISYIGKSGFMLNNELREGDMHSNCEGTVEYFAETIDMARQITDAPVLMVLDSGNDDKKLLDLFENTEVRYVIKRNLRRESKEEWIAVAKQHPSSTRKERNGSITYYSHVDRTVTVEERSRNVRIVVVAHERYCDHKGQAQLIPELAVETYWTNLPSSELVVEAMYRKHATMEQYHAELKHDMGVERLASGKFHANMLHLLFSMIAFNILRSVGMRLLTSGKAPGKRGRRLRLRTVIQGVMYMAGILIAHAGRHILRIAENHAWSAAFVSTA